MDKWLRTALGYAIKWRFDKADEHSGAQRELVLTGWGEQMEIAADELLHGICKHI